MSHRVAVFAMAGIGLAMLSTSSQGGGIYYNRVQFLADPGVTTTTSITFDDLNPGTDLTDQTISGVTFGAPGSGPLVVIAASSGIRNPLATSTAPNVLSPGGSDVLLQNDDLTITFATSVRAAGLDVVLDAPDGASFVSVRFLDEAGNVLGSDSFLPSPVGAPGFQFVGFVSDVDNIKSVVFDEFDDSPPDDHVAYDSLVFTSTPTSAVPEPSSLLSSLLGLTGLVGYAGWKRVRVK